LHPGGGVPVTEIAALGAYRHPIDGALAAGDLLLPNPHHHQGQFGFQRDAELECVPGRLANDRQLGAIRERQGRVVQIAASRQGEAQGAPHLTSAPRIRGKGHHAGAALGSVRLGHCASQTQGAEEPASSGATERGTAGPWGTQRTSQSIEAIGIHPVRSPLRSPPLHRAASCRSRSGEAMRRTTDFLAPPRSRYPRSGGIPVRLCPSQSRRSPPPTWSPTTRLQFRTTIRDRFEETAGLPLWNDAALNAYLAAAIEHRIEELRREESGLTRSGSKLKDGDDALESVLTELRETEAQRRVQDMTRERLTEEIQDKATRLDRIEATIAAMEQAGATEALDYAGRRQARSDLGVQVSVAQAGTRHPIAG
jgi:hypothetical protein